MAGSLDLGSAPSLGQDSLLKSDESNSLRMDAGTKLGSSLFKDGSRPKGVSQDGRKPGEDSAGKSHPQTSGPKQVSPVLHQSRGGQSLKGVDTYRSVDVQEEMFSSLSPEDDSVPQYIQLYRPMIVKCVDCSPLLPSLRDIFNDQGNQ